MSATAFKSTSYVVDGARISFGIPQEAYEWIRDTAKKHGISASRLVDSVVREAVSEYPGSTTVLKLAAVCHEYGIERRALLRIIVVSSIDGKLSKGLRKSFALSY